MDVTAESAPDRVDLEAIKSRLAADRAKFDLLKVHL